MKDVRFYLEFPNRTTKKRSGRANTGHSGNVFAAFLGSTHYGTGGVMQDGIGGVYDSPNSPVATTAASREYLDTCKRIPERLARTIHPALFKRLDKEN